MGSDLVTGLVTFLGGVGGTVVLLMPGYILGKVYSRGIRGPELGETAFVAASAIGGTITHLLMLFWTVPLGRRLVEDWRESAGLAGSHYAEAAAWAAVVLLILPALLGGLFAGISGITRPEGLVWVLRWLGLTTALRTSEAWNWKFRAIDDADRGYWVRIRLKDQAGVFLGKFGNDSLASSSQERRDIFLEKTWEIDENGQPQPESAPNAGVWLAGDEIVSIEFLEFGEKERL